MNRTDIDTYLSRHKGKPTSTVPWEAKAIKWLLQQIDATQTDVAQLFDTLPPHSDEAEAAVLGCMILEPTDNSPVPSTDFYQERHRLICNCIGSLYALRGTVDMVLLKNHMEDKGTLDAVGGVPYLMELAKSVPYATNVEHYASIVRDKANRRRQIEAAVASMKKAYNGAM